MRTDVHVHVSRPVELGRPQLLGENGNGLLVERVVGSGEVDEIRGVDDQRLDPEPLEAIAERRQLRWWRGAALPRRGVVAEHLERVGPDLRRAVRGLDHAMAERQMGADPALIEGHAGDRTRARIQPGPTAFRTLAR